MKVVFVITFPPKYEYIHGPKPDFYWTNKDNQKVSIWRMDRGHVFAREVKRYYPEIEYEVWRLDYRADKEYVREFSDGVVHRSFPAQIVRTRLPGLKKSKYWTSQELLKKLYQCVSLSDEKKQLILHIPLDFSYLGHVILKRFSDIVPFLHTSHLNPTLLKPKVATIHPLKYLHRRFIKRTYEKHLSMLSEIAVSADRFEFFRKHTSSNVYKLNSLNFDFDWAKNKTTKKEARKKLRLPPDAFVLFSSSRLVPEKQLDKMLSSLSRIKDLKYTCIISGAGDVEYEKYLEGLVEKLNLESKVSFVGFLSDDLIDYYCASDVFITTSGSEAGPVSAIKAIALGIPVISTDTGIAAYLLKQHNAGMILDAKDTSHWTEKIRAAIENTDIKTIDPEKLQEEYGLENSTRQLVGYYKQSIANFYDKKRPAIS